MQGVCAVRFADHLPSARPVHDPGNRSNDAAVSARPFLAFWMSLRLRAAPAGFWGCFAASLLSWPRSANLQKALSQELEMWMENGKNNKIKEQFKAEMSTTGHTLLPGSPAVHLVSLCLICGHLWCALSLSGHLLRVQTTICAPFLLTQGARPLALPAAGRRCRQAASQSPPQVAIRISINLKCAI